MFLILITDKQFKKFFMDPIEEVKQGVQNANAKVAKVATDVANLHKKIDAIADAPTAEQWAELKQLTADLNNSLQVVDDATTDEA